jgi:cytochrome c oxidase subunit 1
VILSFGGGLVLLASAILFVRNLVVLHRPVQDPVPAVPQPLFSLAVHPPLTVPAALNGFRLWNVLVLLLMLFAYGYPIAQFFIEPSPGAVVHRVN